EDALDVRPVGAHEYALPKCLYISVRRRQPATANEGKKFRDGQPFTGGSSPAGGGERAPRAAAPARRARRPPAGPDARPPLPGAVRPARREVEDRGRPPEGPAGEAVQLDQLAPLRLARGEGRQCLIEGEQVFDGQLPRQLQAVQRNALPAAAVLVPPLAAGAF